MRAPDIRPFALMLGMCSMAAACATQPEPCTPEWVEWKTDRILDQFADAHRGTVRDLREVSGKIENPSVLTAIRIASLAADSKDLVRDFNEIVIPELNDAIAQCGRPQEFVPAFTGFLRREGVGEDVIDWIEAFGVFLEMKQTS